MKLVRIIAWITCLGAILAIWLRYDSLPSPIPVTRWSLLPKTITIALRIPIINFITLLLLEILSRSLLRLSHPAPIQTALCLLYTLVAAKAVVEAVELLLLPAQHRVIPLLLLIGVAATLGVIGWLLKPMLTDGAWKKMEFTRGEKIAAVALGALYLFFSVGVTL